MKTPTKKDAKINAKPDDHDFYVGHLTADRPVEGHVGGRNPVLDEGEHTEG